MKSAKISTVTGNSVCVIVPTHKPVLNDLEKDWLINNTNILGDYDTFLVCPENMDSSFYNNLGIIHKQTFSENYFKSIKGYNTLLVSEEFYRSFSNYDYMLIMHVDSYVFKDELLYWVSKGYDYIGAPWLEHMYYKDYGDLYGRIGNGGFSLRNIKSCLLYVKENEVILIKKTKNGLPEDLLFAFIQNFKYPTTEEAAKFAYETKPDLCYKITGGKSPFGSHRLNHFNKEIFNKLKETLNI